ncbi:response regulator [Phreatobacter stygius]|uniref:Response regulator transcription factor n=1 Tax=Phreatobacter stygius TaxID=1940610 RepID=A0A4D7AU11_9HYPH|nr:response regulator transcription factor [Phreatobacter stygius]QCI63125.1 response regulator transcription factor [Phreatobacter stygius]
MVEIAIAVVDDHPLLREGIAALIHRRDGFSLAATGSSADDIRTIIATSRPDAMIVDLNMPGDAYQAIAEAAKAAPEMKIIVFTASTSTDHALKALDAGARGYVLKGSSADDLMEAIAAACRGEIFITPYFAAKVIGALQTRAVEKTAHQNNKFSVREDQIVKLLLCGKQNREIASALSLSEKTVKAYMTNLMLKLHARNRVEVVIAAQKLRPAALDNGNLPPAHGQDHAAD